jgi:hypothetical protein
MNDRLDAFVKQLQQQIFDEARETLGKAGYDRRRNPKFNGRMENPAAAGSVALTDRVIRSIQRRAVDHREKSSLIILAA